LSVHVADCYNKVAQDVAMSQIVRPRVKQSTVMQSRDVSSYTGHCLLAPVGRHEHNEPRDVWMKYAENTVLKVRRMFEIRFNEQTESQF